MKINNMASPKGKNHGMVGKAQAKKANANLNKLVIQNRHASADGEPKMNQKVGKV